MSARSEPREPDWVWRYRPAELGAVQVDRAGERAVFVFTAHGGKRRLYACDRSGAAPRPLTPPNETVTWFELAPDGEEIWRFREDRSGNEQGEWLRLPFDGDGQEESIPGLPAGLPYAGVAFGADGLAVAGILDPHATRNEGIEFYRILRGGLRDESLVPIAVPGDLNVHSYGVKDSFMQPVCDTGSFVFLGSTSSTPPRYIEVGALPATPFPLPTVEVPASRPRREVKVPLSPGGDPELPVLVSGYAVVQPNYPGPRATARTGGRRSVRTPASSSCGAWRPR